MRQRQAKYKLLKTSKAIIHFSTLSHLPLDFTRQLLEDVESHRPAAVPSDIYIDIAAGENCHHTLLAIVFDNVFQVQQVTEKTCLLQSAAKGIADSLHVFTHPSTSLPQLLHQRQQLIQIFQLVLTYATMI